MSVAAYILRRFGVLTITDELTDAINIAVNNTDVKVYDAHLCDRTSFFLSPFSVLQQRTNLWLSVLPSTSLGVRRCLLPGAVLHAQKPSLLFSDLFTSFMLIHSFCRNASERGQTQGKEQGFSLVILSLPWTPRPFSWQFVTTKEEVKLNSARLYLHFFIWVKHDT